MCRHS